MSAAMARRARAEERRNSRFRWLRNLPRPRALRVLSRCRLMVISSRLEGGANAVSEALALGVPVLASRVAGNVGLLGPWYPGYFRARSTDGLARLLRQAESDPLFLRKLERGCRRRARLLNPRRERAAWRRLLLGIAR